MFNVRLSHSLALNCIIKFIGKFGIDLLNLFLRINYFVGLQLYSHFFDLNIIKHTLKFSNICPFEWYLTLDSFESV